MKWKKILLIGVVLIVPLFATTACSTSQKTSATEPLFEMNEPVENEEWRITVEAAEEHGTEFSQSGITVWTYEEDSHFFFIQIYLEHLSGEDIGTAFLNKAVVRDSIGETYDWWWAGTPGSYFQYNDDAVGSVKLMGPSVENHFVFVVPDGVKILDFVWPGLPPVRLTIE